VNTAVDTAELPDSTSPLVIDHGDTRTVDQGQQPAADGLSELEQHKRARGYVKPDAPAQVEEPPTPQEAPTPEQVKAEEKKAAERWQDPDTGDHYDMRHKVARRIKAVLEDRGKERAEKEKERAEKEFWKRRAEELERGPAQPRQDAPPQAAAQPNANDPEPDPSDTTKYPEGQFDRAFIRDMGRWAARQETGQRFTEAETRAQQARAHQAEVEAVTQWQGTLPEARKRYADFDSVLERIPNTPENAPIVRLMMNSPVGNDVVYAIATQQTGDGVPLMQLYQRAPNMDSKLRLLHHIEAQLIQAQRAAATRAQTSKTNAPAPIDPVHTAGPAAGAIDWSDPNDKDQYQRWKAQRQNRR
jgi:hypothetical protein